MSTAATGCVRDANEAGMWKGEWKAWLAWWLGWPLVAFIALAVTVCVVTSRPHDDHAAAPACKQAK